MLSISSELLSISNIRLLLKCQKVLLRIYAYIHGWQIATDPGKCKNLISRQQHSHPIGPLSISCGLLSISSELLPISKSRRLPPWIVSNCYQYPVNTINIKQSIRTFSKRSIVNNNFVSLNLHSISEIEQEMSSDETKYVLFERWTSSVCRMSSELR